MTRKTKAALIGFMVPVVPTWGLVIYLFASEERSGWGEMAALFLGLPSILFGVVISAIAYAHPQFLGFLAATALGFRELQYVNDLEFVQDPGPDEPVWSAD